VRAYLFFSLVAFLLASSQVVLCQGTPEAGVLTESLGGLGIAVGKVAYTAVAGKPADPKQVTSDLSYIQKTFVYNRDMDRGVVGVVGANAKVVFTAIDLETGGASMIATLPARWAVNQGLGFLGKQFEQNTVSAFDADLKQYAADNHLTYDARNHASIDDIRNVISNFSSVQEMKASLKDEPDAYNLVDKFETTEFQTVTDEELDKIQENADQIKHEEDQVTDLGETFQSYKDSTNQSIQKLTDRQQATQASVANAQTSIDGLTDEINEMQGVTQANTAQLDSIQDLMYSQASASDKVAMLKSGYLGDDLNGDQVKDLIATNQAQADKEALGSEVATVTNSLANLSTIAAHFHVSPDIVSGLNSAAVVGNAVGSVVSGNYLGAIAGLTGLFGSGPDSSQVILNAMNQQFSQVDQKLDIVIKGEQDLGNDISILSEQVAVYNKDTQTHLAAMDKQLDNIQDLTKQIYYEPFATCKTIKDGVESNLPSREYPVANMRSFDRLQYIAAAGFDYARVQSCISFLGFVYEQSTTMQADSPFKFSPLALKFQSQLPHQTPIDPDKVNQYTKAADQFIEGTYDVAVNFYANAVGQKMGAFAGTAPASISNAFAAAAVPVQDVPSLRTKLAMFMNANPSCDQKTVLGNPMIAMLCHLPPPQPSRPQILNLPKRQSDDVERGAKNAATEFLQTPIFVDGLEEMSDWAEFYAPIYDFEDVGNGKFPKNAADFLSGDHVLPKSRGYTLVEGALNLDTLGIAQMNTLYGDVLAATVFNELWDATSGFPASADGLKDAKATAAKILSANNTFLQRNVLMLALDQARVSKTKGWDNAYAFALDYMRDSFDLPDAQLNQLFQKQIKFKNVLFPLDVKHAGDTSYCDGLPDAEKSKQCIQKPVAVLAGIDVKLPSVSQFSDRTLVYPQMLTHLIQRRDELAELAAEYEVLDYAVADAKNQQDKDARTAQLTQSIVEAFK
jgi:hypothetical protein